MISPAPRVIILDIGRRSVDRHAKAEPLCIDEMLSLVEELADLGVGRIRLLLHDVEAIDDLDRLIRYARRRRCAVTAVCRTQADAASIAAIADARPDAIAVLLHSHIADVHYRAGSGIEWSQSIHMARAVHETGTPLEIETTITAGNALPLLPLSEVVESLHAASWHLDFSHALLDDALATSTATALVHIAASGRIRLTVHDLPLLHRIVRQHTAGLTSGTPPLMAITASADTMHVSWSGDVRTCASDIAVGNVRLQTLDAIQERSRVCTALPFDTGRKLLSLRASV